MGVNSRTPHIALIAHISQSPSQAKPSVSPSASLHYPPLPATPAQRGSFHSISPPSCCSPSPWPCLLHALTALAARLLALRGPTSTSASQPRAPTPPAPPQPSTSTVPPARLPSPGVRCTPLLELSGHQRLQLSPQHGRRPPNAITMTSPALPAPPSTTIPFTLLYTNARRLPPDESTAWSYKLCSPPSSSSSSSPSPLPQLVAFVEAGNCGVRTPPPGWESRHLPGSKRGVGGITLFFHPCAVRTVTELHPVPRPPDRPSHSDSTSALILEVAPPHRDPFLLATCYLTPPCAGTGGTTHFIKQITLAISSAVSHSMP